MGPSTYFELGPCGSIPLNDHLCFNNSTTTYKSLIPRTYHALSRGLRFKAPIVSPFPVCRSFESRYDIAQCCILLSTADPTIFRLSDPYTECSSITSFLTKYFKHEGHPPNGLHEIRSSRSQACKVNCWFEVLGCRTLENTCYEWLRPMDDAPESQVFSIPLRDVDWASQSSRSITGCIRFCSLLLY
jgi:hypothetical protein